MLKDLKTRKFRLISMVGAAFIVMHLILVAIFSLNHSVLQGVFGDLDKVFIRPNLAKHIPIPSSYFGAKFSFIRLDGLKLILGNRIGDGEVDWVIFGDRSDSPRHVCHRVDPTIVVLDIRFPFECRNMSWGLSLVGDFQKQRPTSFGAVVEFNHFIQRAKVGFQFGPRSFNGNPHALLSGVSSAFCKPDSGNGGYEGDEADNCAEISHQEALVTNNSPLLRTISSPDLLSQILGIQAILFGSICAGIAFANGFVARKLSKLIWFTSGTAGMVIAYGGLRLFMTGELWGPW